MKKLSILFLAFILLSSCFVFVGCGQSVDITDDITVKPGTPEISTDKTVWIFKCYVDPEVLDLSTAEDISVKVNGKNYVGVVPEDSTEDNNYFMVRIITERYAEWPGFSVDKCTVRLANPSDKDKEPTSMEDYKELWTILFGIAYVIIGAIVHWAGIEIFESVAWAFAPMVIGVLLAVGMFIAFGWGCGLIMSGFFIIYLLVHKWQNKVMDVEDSFFN